MRHLFLLLVCCCWSLASEPAAATRFILEAPLVAGDGGLPALIDRAQAMRDGDGLVWLADDTQDDGWNWKRRYGGQATGDDHAVTLIRSDYTVAAPSQWVVRVHGACAFRLLLNGQQIAAADYARGHNRYLVVDLEAGPNRVELITGRPAAQSAWSSGLDCGPFLTEQGYNDAHSAFITCWLPRSFVTGPVVVAGQTESLCELSTRDLADSDVVVATGLVPYLPGTDVYDAASIRSGADKRLPIDLAPVARLRDFEAETEAGIRAHRCGDLVIEAPAGTQVAVALRRHDFPFGTAIDASLFHADEAAFMAATARARQRPEPKGVAAMTWDEYHACQQRYQQLIIDHFNWGVHHNSLKWYRVEGREGKTNLAPADRVLAFCEANDITMRGHTLFWEVPKYTKGWRAEAFENSSAAEIERMVMARAIGQTWYYRGRINEWDLNNEMLHGRLYRDLLGDDIVAKMADWALIGNPQAKLYLNDFAILNANDGDAYVEQIRDLLAQGVPIAGIGCQSHFFGRDVDVFHVRDTLDKLAQFGLPIKATEFDIGGSPEQQARSFTAFYRTLFGHKAVDGILMWGFWAGRHWRNGDAPWALDFTPRPSAEAYMRLIHEDWHTAWSGTADEQGRVVVPGAFYGLYDVTIDGQTDQRWHRAAVD